MDHLVAIALELEGGARRFYMTWGRIQHPVDPEPLEQLVLRYCVKNDLGGDPLKARMCRTLQEASHAPYFYEALFSFSQTHIPFGDQYESWRSAVDERMQRGEELYYLGNPDRFAPAEQVISPSVEETQGAETDWVTVIESHIDNMSGELLGGLMERLFSAGALDVS